MDRHTNTHKDKKGCGLMEGIEKRKRTYEDISGTTLMRIPEVGVLQQLLHIMFNGAAPANGRKRVFLALNEQQI